MKKNNKLSFLIRTALPMLLGIALMAYVIVRAAIIPITHDESNTCLTYSTMSIHDIVTYAIPIPNNHILNTLLIKFFTSLFGMNPVSARLPNILGFALYFVIIFLFTRKITKDPFITFFGVCVMVCNPYLIDFFSLARGYALSISFMMTSLYFAFLFIEKHKNKNLISSVFFGMFAVYTNFTTLNFYAAQIGILAIVILQNNWALRKTNQNFIKTIALQLSIILTGTLLLAAASYLPISRMIATDQFVFWGTNGFYKDTVITLLFASQYNVEYFGMKAIGLSYIIIVFAAMMFLCAVFEFIANKGIIGRSTQVFFMFVFIGAIAVNILQFYLVHTPYLTSRTALFFYPLMAINFIFFAEWLRRKLPASRLYFSLPLSLLAVIHFTRAANFSSCFEWWYDADTYTVLNYLENEHQKNNAIITLNSSWWFFPSLNFHIVTEHKDWIKLAPFHQEFNADTVYKFYYTTSDEKPRLDSLYDTTLSLGWNSRFLMKQKEKIEK